MNTQLHDLNYFLQSVNKKIEDDYLLAQKHVSNDPGTAGDQGEETWANILREWLPPIYEIVTKGRIINPNGNESPQVDILVLDPYYPKGLLKSKYYLSCGVIAAFECKLTLKKDDIYKTIKNAASIRRIFSKREGTPFRELYSPLIYGLLSHSHSWKSKNEEVINLISDHLFNADNKYTDHPSEMLDIICVSNLSTWNSSKSISRPVFVKSINRQFGLHGITGYNKLSTNRLFVGADYSPIGLALTYLLVRLAKEDANLRKLASYFNKVHFYQEGTSKCRIWKEKDQNIFSTTLINDLDSPIHDFGDGWDEWTPYII